MSGTSAFRKGVFLGGSSAACGGVLHSISIVGTIGGECEHGLAREGGYFA
jgi:hypothetical protein